MLTIDTMSYLDVPRLHFAGRFFSDPSTVNNSTGGYQDASSVPTIMAKTGGMSKSEEKLVEWNPLGNHHFTFKGCKIKSVVNAAGTIETDKTKDVLIDGKVTSNSGRAAKLVDLDPEHQTASQIYGMTITVTDTKGASFSGTLKTPTLRDLWFGRSVGNLSGAGGVFQSVLTGVTWSGDTNASPVMKKLRATSATKLSIKFVTYAYDDTHGGDPRKPSARADFAHGKVVGTIGPWKSGEPDHYIAARRIDDGNQDTIGIWQSAFGPASFKVDMARGSVVADMGNAIGESSPGGPVKSVGTLTAFMKGGPVGVSTTLFTGSFNQTILETTAGVIEIKPSAQQLQALNAGARLALRSSTLSKTILQEHTDGSYVDADEVVLRINPGESKKIELRALTFGRAKSNQAITVRKLHPSYATSGVSLAKSPTSKTDANGKMVLTFKVDAAGPGGTKRANNLDGQLLRYGVFWGSSALSAQLRAVISIHAYEKFTIPANPKWSHVKDILSAYHYMYPTSSMSFFELDDHAFMKGSASTMIAVMSRAFTDPGFMPVTRDLSKAKTETILKWLKDGAP